MIRFGRASPQQIDTLFDVARDSELTYSEIGGTKIDSSLPRGFKHIERTVELLGDDCFDRAKVGLQQWQAHLGAGVQIFPRAPLTPGQTILADFRLGPLHIIFGCRIVYFIDEVNRYGFAYGTLLGHPEIGEESFVVQRTGSKTTFQIRAFSKPSSFVIKATSPVGHLLQIKTTKSYGEALQEFISQGSTT